MWCDRNGRENKENGRQILCGAIMRLFVSFRCMLKFENLVTVKNEIFFGVLGVGVGEWNNQCDERGEEGKKGGRMVNSNYCPYGSSMLCKAHMQHFCVHEGVVKTFAPEVFGLMLFGTLFGRYIRMSPP